MMTFTPPLSQNSIDDINVYLNDNHVVVEGSRTHPNDIEIRLSLLSSGWSIMDHHLNNSYLVFNSRDVTDNMTLLIQEIKSAYLQ